MIQIPIIPIHYCQHRENQWHLVQWPSALLLLISIPIKAHKGSLYFTTTSWDYYLDLSSLYFRDSLWLPQEAHGTDLRIPCNALQGSFLRASNRAFFPSEATQESSWLWCSWDTSVCIHSEDGTSSPLDLLGKARTSGHLVAKWGKLRKRYSVWGPQYWGGFASLGLTSPTMTSKYDFTKVFIEWGCDHALSQPPTCASQMGLFLKRNPGTEKGGVLSSTTMTGWGQGHSTPSINTFIHTFLAHFSYSARVVGTILLLVLEKLEKFLSSHIRTEIII